MGSTHFSTVHLVSLLNGTKSVTPQSLINEDKNLITVWYSVVST